MSRAVRNALVFAGLVVLTWALLVLAWRIVRWLLVVAVWVIALTVAVGVLLARVVTQRFPPWWARVRARHARNCVSAPEMAP